MTPNEYREYLQSLRDLLPGFSQWLDGTIRETAPEARKAAKQRSVDAWYSATYDRLELADATAALRSIHRGDEGDTTGYGFYDQLHAKVATVARRYASERARRKQAEETFRVTRREDRLRCWLCEDTGLVCIFTAEAMRKAAKNHEAFLRGESVGIQYETTSVACNCERASADAPGREPRYRFDAELHCKFGRLEEDRVRLVEHLRTLKARRCDNSRFTWNPDEEPVT